MKEQSIVRTWITGKSSCTLIIPREFAEKYGLVERVYIVLEGKPEGILIKRLLI
jgi:hypothetical protein